MKRWFACLSAISACLLIASQGLAADMEDGRNLYGLHCEACHGTNGKSADPMIPSFADGDTLFQMDPVLLKKIREGTMVMPAYRGLLSDEEIRDIISYLRTF